MKSNIETINGKKYRIREVNVLDGIYLSIPLIDGARHKIDLISTYSLMGKNQLDEYIKTALQYVDKVVSDDHKFPLINEQGNIADPTLTIVEALELFRKVVDSVQEAFPKADSSSENPPT